MFLFKKHKNLGHKQTATVGFVLAVMSLLVNAFFAYLVPLIPAWLYANGVYSLDIFFMTFVVVMFLSLQALILFGFPLYYAKDKKSHMTGFRILLYALGWEVLMMCVVILLTFAFTESPNPYQILEDMDWESLEQTSETSIDYELDGELVE